MLTLLVEQYERQQYPMEDVDPIEFIKHVMQSKGRVADILNRTRPLTQYVALTVASR